MRYSFGRGGEGSIVRRWRRGGGVSWVAADERGEVGGGGERGEAGETGDSEVLFRRVGGKGMRHGWAGILRDCCRFS